MEVDESEQPSAIETIEASSPKSQIELDELEYREASVPIPQEPDQSALKDDALQNDDRQDLVSKEELKEILNLKESLLKAEEDLKQADLAHDEDLHNQSLQITALENDLASSNQKYLDLESANQELRTQNDSVLQQLADLKAIVEKNIPDEPEDRVRVADLEREKRDLVSIVDSLQSEKDTVEASFTNLREQYTSTATTLRTVELTLTNATDAERTMRMRIQGVEAELAIVTKDRDWHKQELANAETSARSYRAEKHSQIVSLQTSLEAASQQAESSTTALKSLKTSHASLEGRLTDSLSRVAALQGDLAEAESTFKRDMDSQKRLVDLLTKRDEDARRRLEEIEREWQNARSEIDSREQDMVAQLDKERQRADRLEAKVSDLRELAERRANGTIDADESAVNGDLPLMSTPIASTSRLSNISASMALSPAAALAARLQKTGRSYTDIYSDYMALQSQLAGEKAEVARLTECLSSILADIEDRAPILRDQRAEYERSMTECQSLAAELARIGQERDEALRKAQNSQAEADAANRENGFIAQQLRDLGRQARQLVRALAAAEDPMIVARMSDDDFEDEMLQIAGTSQVEECDTDAVISTELVTFRSVSELQANNQKLLRIVRELGRQMEEQDQALRNRIERTENHAVQEAHDLILKLRDEVQSSRVNVEAIGRERDMLRRLVSQNSPHSTALTISAGPGSIDDNNKERLAETQASFEAYRAEMTTDLQTLKHELNQAQRDCRVAEVASAKATSQMDYLRERLRLANESQERTTKETAQLNKNMAKLQASLAKQDEAVHQVNEQILSLRSERDRLQNELRNARAEREVWKSTEARIMAENNALQREQSQLSDLMRNLHSMQHEVERSSSDSRTRFEDQLQKLNGQLDDARSKLSQESAAHRQLVLRREVEVKELREKRDVLSEQLAESRQQLAVTTSSLSHLEQRILDRENTLKAKDEKLAIYEGRRLSGTGSTTDPSLPKEQRLELELADLRASLRAAQIEAQQSKADVEQLRAISQANEEALNSITATYDEHKQSTATEIASKEAELSSLREQVTSLGADMIKASDEVSEAHRSSAERESGYKSQLQDVQQTMAHLRESAAAAEREQAAARADLAVQAQTAAEAQQKYQGELIAHAEDARLAASLKEESSSLRQQFWAAREQLRSAEANLATSQASWESQRKALQKEVEDVTKRYEDARNQNTLLHDHLADVTSQATKIQRSNVDGLSSSTSGESSDSQLQQVVQYLRNEQSILEMQLHIEKQDKARLSIKLEHAEHSVDQARAALSEERDASSQSQSLTAQHEELLAKVTQLSILRESNDTLRAESDRNTSKVRQLSDQVRHLNEEIYPLRGEIASLQAEIETRDGQIKLLTEDNARWKSRNEQVLAKYERIDPAELQSLKDQVELLKAANTDVEKLRQDAAVNLSRVQDELSTSITTATRERDEAVAKVRMLEAQVNELNERNSQTTAMQENTVKTLGEARIRFTTLQGTARTQRIRLNELENELSALKDDRKRSKEDGEVQEQERQSASDDQQKSLDSLNEQINNLSSQLSAQSAAHDALQHSKIQLESALKEANERGADPALVQAEVTRRLADGSTTDVQGDSESQTNARIEELRTSMDKEKTIAVEQTAKPLQKQIDQQAAEISALRTKIDSLTKIHEEKLVEAKRKIEESEASESTRSANLAAQLNEIKGQLSASQAKEAAFETQQAEMQVALEAAQALARTVQPADDAQALIEAALSRERENLEQAKVAREAEFNQQLANIEEEGTKKLATFRSQVSRAQSQLNAEKEKTTELKEKISELEKQISALRSVQSTASLHTNGAAATPSTAAPPTTPTVALSIKGKASELPPVPQSSQARQTKQTSQTTPPSVLSVRGAARGENKRGKGGRAGAGRGVSIGNAIAAAVDSNAGSAPSTPSGSKRGRPEDDIASGDESVKKARQTGPVTRAQG